MGLVVKIVQQMQRCRGFVTKTADHPGRAIAIQAQVKVCESLQTRLRMVSDLSPVRSSATEALLATYAYAGPTILLESWEVLVGLAWLGLTRT
jgi:hypothetical protein